MAIYRNKQKLFKKKDDLESTYVPMLFLKLASNINEACVAKRKQCYPFWLSDKELFGQKQYWSTVYADKENGQKLILWIPEFLCTVLAHEIFFPHILGENRNRDLPYHFHGLAMRQLKITAYNIASGTVEKDALELLVDQEIFICLEEDLIRLA